MCTTDNNTTQTEGSLDDFLDRFLKLIEQTGVTSVKIALSNDDLAGARHALDWLRANTTRWDVHFKIERNSDLRRCWFLTIKDTKPASGDVPPKRCWTVRLKQLKPVVNRGAACLLNAIFWVVCGGITFAGGAFLVAAAVLFAGASAWWFWQQLFLFGFDSGDGVHLSHSGQLWAGRTFIGLGVLLAVTIALGLLQMMTEKSPTN